jgi:DNA polymerase III subunit epsilon
VTGRSRLVVAVASLSLLLVAGVALLGLGVWAEAPAADRVVMVRALRSQTPVLVSGGVLLAGAAALVVIGLFRRHLRAARRLAADTRLIATVNAAHRLAEEGPADLADLAAAINGLAERFEAADRDVIRRVEAGRAELARERNRLAALMSELAAAVLVCNADGRILLYNAAARGLLEDRPDRAGVVGLGRSIFGVVDRDLVAHVLDRSRTGRPIHATTAWGDRILRVHVAPVASADTEEPTGFVVLVEDVTRRAETTRQRDALLRELTEGVRGAAGAIRGAIESLSEYPDMPDDQRERFLRIVRDEAVALGRRVDNLMQRSADHLTDRSLHEDISAADLLAAVTATVRAEHGPTIRTENASGGVWLTVDGFAAVRAVAGLLGRLRTDHGVEEVTLDLTPAGRYAALTARWRGTAVEPQTLRTWTVDGATGIGPDTIADVLTGHDAEVWSQSAEGGSAYLRLLLPIAEEPEGPPARPAPAAGPGRPAPVAESTGEAAARPEFYDFDLFESKVSDVGWGRRGLDEIAYTVFDTETTGLQPAEGDEIISIGAVRVVNGRLLRQETFDRLVDPRRPVPAVSRRIHGITAEMLRGQPTIGEVLLAFARFAEDTVLVGHNVSFDLAFLRRKEAQTGVVLVQPVLDTLLLSALVHPDHEEHTMEAIAARLGVEVVGRHSALGDALLTGELFARLLPLLREMGIHTLGEAREASQRTYHARIDRAQYRQRVPRSAADRVNQRPVG